MLKLMEIVGMLAPVAGIVVLFWYRRRAPRAVVLGILGALFAVAASAVEFIGGRAAYFGGGGLEDIYERVEQWSLLRLALLLAGVVLLTIAALVGAAEGRRTRGALVAVGVTAAAIGTALGAVTVDIHAEHEFVNFLIPMVVEAAQFALLGAGVFVLSIAVVSRRPSDDGRKDPLTQARRAATTLWDSYRRTRTRR